MAEEGQMMMRSACGGRWFIMRERIRQQMEEIWKEVTAKRTNEEWVKSRLAWEDWESLGREAVGLANQGLKRHCWRGARGGVAPRGYDAEAIAWEAIGNMVAGKSRLVAGWTRERLVEELGRMIRGKVRLLWSLKETQVMRSEWDIAPRKANGEPVSVLSNLAGEGQTGYEAAVKAEAGRESWKTTVEAQLEGDPGSKAVFGCLWEGVTRTEDIARRLGMTERSVVLARRRLAGRLKRLGRTGVSGSEDLQKPLMNVDER